MPDVATPKTASGWTTVSFGDVVQLSKERTSNPEADGCERCIGLEHIDPGELRVRQWGDVADGVTFTNVFKPGQVLFGKRRAYQRKVAVADFSGVCSGDIFVLEPKDDALLPELLPFICKTDAFFEHAVGTSAGSLSPRTNWKSLADYQFLLPSISDQRRILAILIPGADLVTRTRVLGESAATLARCTSAHLFSDVVSRDETEGVPLGDVFDQIVDRGYEGLPILSVTIDGEIVRRDSLGRNVSDATGDQKYLRVLPGDIAYNTMRLWQGAVGVAKEEGIVSAAYTVLRRSQANIEPEFLLEMLRSPAIQRHYRRFVTGVASDRWRLYFRDLQRIRVSIPAGADATLVVNALRELRRAERDASDRVTKTVAILEVLRRRCLGS